MTATIHYDRRGLPFAATLSGSDHVILPDEDSEMQSDVYGADRIDRVTHVDVDWELACFRVIGRQHVLGQGTCDIATGLRDRLRTAAAAFTKLA